MYGDEPPLGVPKQVLVPVDVRGRRHLRGVADATCAAVEGADPGARSAATSATLHETVTRNAKEEFIRHRLRRAGDHNARSRALTELQDLLGLPEAPLRIECYDMAHLQGTDYVGSMVVLEDGLPNKREYRRFKVKDVPGQRRLRGDGGGAHPPAHRVPERARPPARRASWRTDVARAGRRVRVPAAAARSSTAARVSSPSPSGSCSALGLADEIPIASLAKRFEEVYVPGRSEPVDVPRGSEALFMLQRIRDEAHRFANTFHRELRGKRMTASSLDGIPGLGETPQEAADAGDGRRQRGEAGVARRPAGAVVPARRRRRRGLREFHRARRRRRRRHAAASAPTERRQRTIGTLTNRRVATSLQKRSKGSSAAALLGGVAPRVKSGSDELVDAEARRSSPIRSTQLRRAAADERHGPPGSPPAQLRWPRSASSTKNTIACAERRIVDGSRPTCSHASRNDRGVGGRRSSGSPHVFHSSAHCAVSAHHPRAGRADQQRQPDCGFGDRTAASVAREVRAVERRPAPREQPVDDLDRLGEAVDPLARRGQLDAVRGVLVDLPAGADAEHARGRR